jgi:hypothetical protein
MSTKVRKCALGAVVVVLALAVGHAARAAPVGLGLSPGPWVPPVAPTGDPEYTYTFTDVYNGVSASGVIDVNGDVAYAGNLTVTGPPYEAGTYTLTPVSAGNAGAFGGYPSGFYSPNGMFYYDNVVVASASQPGLVLDPDGLLFGNAAQEINIFGNGSVSANSYSFYSGGATGYQNPTNTGTFTITGASLTDPPAVPEPAFFQGGVLLALAGGGILRRRFLRNRRQPA